MKETLIKNNLYSKPAGQSTTCLHVGEYKGKGFPPVDITAF